MYVCECVRKRERESVCVCERETDRHRMGGSGLESMPEVK